MASQLSRKDMRRPDLAIPYVEATKKESETDVSSTISTTLPMAAMFTRNKMIGWTAVIFSLQNWLAETPESRRTSTQPGIFGVGMAFFALAVTYSQLFLPPPVQRFPSPAPPTQA